MQTTRPVTVLAGRYALDKRLGRSATGMVWLATDTLLHRRVTVKVVHPRLADDPVFAAALTEEVRRVAGLADPGLARLLDSGRERGVTFVVREHVEGRSLRTRLNEAGPLPLAEAVGIIVVVLQGLGAAHEAGTRHLALDPDDVIVSNSGQIRLTDLGIGAAIANAKPAEAVELLGANRLAPEQAAGGPVDARTDIYLAAALAFELLTGEPPRGRTSVREVRKDVPRGVDRAIARALSTDPDKRFPDTLSFRSELTPDGDHEDLFGPPDTPKAGAGLVSWVGIPLLIAGVAAAAIALGLWVGTLEVGGPLGIRPTREEPPPARVALRAERPISAVAVDPFGDDRELSTNAPRAVDGDLATLWRSEDYFDGELGKPGIGLVLDMGQTRRIVGLRLWTPHPGYSFQIAIGDDPATLVADVGDEEIAASITRLPLDATGRYVLVWITSVVPTGDGNRAEVAEVRIVVPVPEGSDA
jgi:serine/threonine-protein kinase